MKLISFSLYGSNPKYTQGCICTVNAYKHLLSDYQSIVYVGNDVPQEIVNKLKEIGARVETPNQTAIPNGMFWRFLAIDIDGVDRVLIRDTDSRPTQREIDLIRKWENTDKQLFITRDHPGHNVVIPGGGFGMSKIGFKITPLILARSYNCQYSEDQSFLAQELYSRCTKLIFDSYYRYQEEKSDSSGNIEYHVLPFDPNFLYDVVDVYTEKTFTQNLLEHVKDKYLYFHYGKFSIPEEKLFSLYYLLLEMLCFAKIWGRTLVLPEILVYSGNCTYFLDIEKYFHLERLRININTISWRDFCRKNISNGVIFRGNDPFLSVGDTNTSKVISTPYSNLFLSGPIQVNVKGYSMISIQDSLGCKDIPFLAIENYEIISRNHIISDKRTEYLHTRKMFDIHDSFYEKAEEFMKQEDLNDAVAIFWNSKTLNIPVENFISQIQSEISIMKKIFLLSDKIDEIKSLLSDYDIITYNCNKNPIKNQFIGSLICSMCKELHMITDMNIDEQARFIYETCARVHIKLYI